MLRAYFELAPKDIWSDLKGDQLNFTLSQRKARKKNKKDCSCQNLWGSNKFGIRQSATMQSYITILRLTHLFKCFILIQQLCSATYLLLTWINESTRGYSLCKLSRLRFVLSCDCRVCAVLALRWHVIIMASMTTMAGFLKSLGTLFFLLFFLAAGHVKQIAHRVVFCSWKK